ncbi:MAG: endolytic transglycosylase MltG [bacterium]
MAKQDNSSNKENDKKNGKKGKNGKKVKVLGIIVVILGVISVGSGIVGYSLYNLYSNGGINLSKRDGIEEREVQMTIPEGTSIKSIGEALETAGIVDNSTFFYLKCKYEDIGTKFQAGDFILTNKMDFEELVVALERAIVQVDNSDLKLLIKEGDTQESIANNLASMGIVSYEEFMSVANNLSDFYSFDFVQQIPQSSSRTSRLEGYLYPDTYFLSDDETAETIILRLLNRFDQLYTDELKAKTIQAGLTIDEVVTIASIIEKEIKYAPERAIAASVIFNRLEVGMKLQMDATVLYAKQEHSDRTTIADTQIESPYNTYYIDGIPVGPIANPSISCIEAVLNPANTDYIYYVVEDDSTGQHFYTSDYNEFLKAKQEYLKKFD